VPRVLALDVGSELARRERGFGCLVGFLSRKGVPNEDRGDVGFVRNQPPLEKRLCQSDRLELGELVCRVFSLEVDEIVVTADRFSREKEIQPGFVSIDADQLAEMPGIIEGDPIRSLQLLPGVQAASDISSGLYVRGGGPDQTVVLLDGVPVYNPTHAFGFFSTFNADVLDEVNLYKGAYPAKYGGRLGAVLDVNSATGNRREVRGKAGVSTIAARLTLEGPAIIEEPGGTSVVPPGWTVTVHASGALDCRNPVVG